MFYLLYFYREDAESVSSRAEAESLSTTDSHQLRETDRALTTRPLSQKRYISPIRDDKFQVIGEMSLPRHWCVYSIHNKGWLPHGCSVQTKAVA